jgi:predicted AlkP superfamily pyrophosphatase or phosphodiesterase
MSWPKQCLFALAACCWLSPAAEQNAPKPYVILVSLDGFRYDYAQRYHAVNLLSMRSAGAAADAMIPSFPSLTFPNHLSIVTGLYPDRHGIVGNSFYDPQRKESYSSSKTATDGTWYQAKPLWVVAEEQKVKSACMFWPTSDAEVAGVRPSYWFKYDGHLPNQERVARVLNWLRLPESERPHLITLYFSDADDAGHKFGPDSKELEQAVQQVDNLIGELQLGIQSSGLPVNLIVVSDHGMQTIENAVDLRTYADLSKFQVISSGPFALVYAPDPQAAEQVYRQLKRKHGPYDVYRRSETPARWHYSQNPRIGDLVVMAKGASRWVVTPSQGEVPKGAHGFDPARWKTMGAIFFAVGPNIRHGVHLKQFENVEVFSLVARILGLQESPGLDGRGRKLSGVYQP